MKLYILTPEKQLVSVAEWRKAKNPASANFVVIENNDGSRFMLYKKKLADGREVDYDTAKKLAAEFTLDGFKDFTLGDIDRWCSTYEARYIDGYDLDDALDIIDGDSIRNWNWTDRAFQSYSYNAWVFNGNNGYLYGNSTRINAVCARVFRAF